MERELVNKIQQVGNKVRQAELKIESDCATLEQAKVDVQIAKRQLEGIKNLYEKGLKSLTELEEKKAKMQESEAKLVGAENKLASAQNDLDIYKTELQLTQNEYANKVAKAQSDKYSTLSEKFDAQASVNKLRIERENYSLLELGCRRKRHRDFRKCPPAGPNPLPRNRGKLQARRQARH